MTGQLLLPPGTGKVPQPSSCTAAAARQKALSICRTLGVSGGPDAAAKAASMKELTAAVQRHLLGKN